MLFDTSAWIELFNKTNNYARVKQCLQTKQCYTSIVSIAEISQWARRQNIDGQLLAQKITEHSKIIDLNNKIAFFAGELNHNRKKAGIKWGMMDSLIVATAHFYGLPVLTKDIAFRNISDTELL